MLAVTSCSAIYTGWVRHRRHSPRTHAFRYKMYLLYLDLDELEDVFSGSLIWSVTRPSIAWFRRKDHIGNPEVRLSDSIRDLVHQRTGDRPSGPIRLLTHLRYFGFCMNPVSFYYIFDEGDTRVETIVAEVHNTPWGERHCYVLPRDPAIENPRKQIHRFKKSFHVSPFMPMDQEYVWQLSDPSTRLLVHMVNEQEGIEVFDATMVLDRVVLNKVNRMRVLLRYPFMTGKVIAAIYWQALRLWIKKIPFHTHPRKLTAGG